jgi:hypothetical protein
VDDSRTIRERLIASLSDAVRDATLAGDLAAARTALDALNALLAAQSGAPAPVTSLLERRRS